jgi:hypothetical protein
LPVLLLPTPLRGSEISRETPSNDDAATSSVQAEVRREDHCDELMVTKELPGPREGSSRGGRKFSLSASLPCLSALSCADTGQGGSHLLP